MSIRSVLLARHAIDWGDEEPLGLSHEEGCRVTYVFSPHHLTDVVNDRNCIVGLEIA